MEKFQAKSPDLILELVTLGDEKLILEPKLIMNGENVVKIIQKWDDLENKQKKEKKLSPIEIIADELEMIYPKNKIWFLQNFDFGTLNDILMHVAKTLGGIKKNTKN